MSQAVDERAPLPAAVAPQRAALAVLPVQPALGALVLRRGVVERQLPALEEAWAAGGVVWVGCGKEPREGERGGSRIERLEKRKRETLLPLTLSGSLAL